jgi:sulfur relay (sulfurtransferase) DsrC/TusE family protein
MESLLGEEKVSSCQTSVTVQKRLNFLSDRWIVLKFLQEFLEAFFLSVDMKSLLCEPKVRSRQTRVTAQKGSNF